MLRVIVLFVCAAAVAGQGRTLHLPKADPCIKRIELSSKFRNGHHYYFSWSHSSTRNQVRDWLDARNICRKHCQDLVSIESQSESNFVIDAIQAGNVGAIWTSGRKCNFGGGCDKAEFQPPLINGWFWSGSGKRMRPPHSGGGWSGDWSTNGPSGKRQPDNHDRRSDEPCVAVLNNAFRDGIKWHDLACNNRQQWICEDSDELLGYARRTFTNVTIP